MITSSKKSLILIIIKISYLKTSNKENDNKKLLIYYLLDIPWLHAERDFSDLATICMRKVILEYYTRSFVKAKDICLYWTSGYTTSIFIPYAKGMTSIQNKTIITYLHTLGLD